MPVFLERFILPVFAAAVVVLAVANPMGFDWKQRVMGSLALLFGAGFVAYTVHKKPSPEFKADVIQSIDHSMMSFWVAAESVKRVYPIDVFLNMRIVSLHSVARSIDSFGIEVTTPSSPNWVPLTMIAVEGDYHVYGGPMKAAFLSTVEPPVWNQALKAEIQPGRT